MPTLTVLIGLPGSGKSTYISRNARDPMGTRSDPPHIVSLYDLVMEWADHNGMTYDDAFPKVNMEELKRELRDRRDAAYREGRDVIIDMPNMSDASRRNIGNVPKHYLRKAVVFVIPPDLLASRLESRSLQGKTIPPHVIETMRANFQCLSMEEFPDGITYVRD